MGKFNCNSIQALCASFIPAGLLIFLFMMFAMPTSKIANIGFYLFVMLPVLLSSPLLLKEKVLVSDLLPIGLVIISWVLLSMIQVDIDHWEKVGKEARHALYVLVFLTATYYVLLTQKVAVKKLIEYIFWMVVIYSVVSMLVYYGWQGRSFSSRIFPILRLGSPIFVSVIIAVYGVSIFYSLLNEGQRLKAILLLGLMLFFIYFYNARTALVGLCFGVLLVIVTVQIKHKKLLFLLTFIILASYILASYYYGNLLNRGVSYRVDIWLSAFQKAVDCGVLLGCGLGVDSKITIADGNVFQHPHNIYLDQLIKTGILGLLGLLGVIAYVVIRGLKARSCMVWGLIAGLVALVFDGKDLLTNPDDMWLIFWLPLIIVYWEIKRGSADRVANSDASAV